MAVFFFLIGDTDGWYDRSEEGNLRRVLARGSGVAKYLDKRTRRRVLVQRVRRRCCFVIKDVHSGSFL